jgi:hypothetical protein
MGDGPTSGHRLLPPRHARIVDWRAIAWLADAMRASRASPWSEAVTTRVARGLLATLRDFGVLEGARGGVTSRSGIHIRPSVVSHTPAGA